MGGLSLHAPAMMRRRQRKPCSGSAKSRRRKACAATYWRAVDAMPQARRPNPREEMTHPRIGEVELRELPQRVGVEVPAPRHH
jgi:hypothetical protein